MTDTKKPATSSRIAEAAREIARRDDGPWESVGRSAPDCVPHWDARPHHEGSTRARQESASALKAR